jgi:hypothetical protein
MDADRRRKTVIAGTFAIARKSLSNAQPISADEIASHHPGRHESSHRCTRRRSIPLKPAPGGIYARHQARAPLSEFRSRPTDIGEAGGGIDSGRLVASDRQGKIRSIEMPLVFASRHSRFRRRSDPAANFCFR